MNKLHKLEPIELKTPADDVFQETVSRYGRFTEDGACFEMTEEPPRKWRNSHYNEVGDVEVHSDVTHIGDGSTFFRTAGGKKVSMCTWENKYLYIRDDETNLVFNPGGAPVPTPVQDKVARFYAATTELSCVCEELAVTQRFFVPRCHPVEVWTATIENRSDRERKVSLFGYIQQGIPGGMIDVETELGGVFVHKHAPVEPDFDNCIFFCTRSDFFAATARRDCFHNFAYTTGAPRILNGDDLDNGSGHTWDTFGVVQCKVTIPAGETARLDFFLGHARTVEDAIAIRDELTPDRIEELCREQVEIEERRAAAYRIDVGNPNLNGLINGFSKKQLYSYLMNKSGFRDNLQVIMALSMTDYEASEAALLRALASQHEEGWPPHSYKPLNPHRCSDKPTWILMVVPWMIKESGDYSLLEKEVPYFEGSLGSVWDHVLRAMRFLANDTRKNGLCDLHDGDWNDGLQPKGGDAGGRESIMVTEQLCYGLLEVQALAKKIGDEAVAEEARVYHAKFVNALNENAWDGDWYQRVLCDDGFIVGTHKAEEGSFYMNAQSWAVLGGVCDEDRGNHVMDMVEKYCGLDIGYRVCNPPFSKYDARIGQNSTVYPGVTENGGCYNHAAGFKGVADCVLGRAEKAWDTFRKVSPDNPENPVTHSGNDPFSYVNLFFADNYWYGRAFYPWNTGTAAWMVSLIVEYILGARRDYDGLRIDPCLTKRIPQARVVRQFRGATYDIRLDNTAGRCNGVTSMTIDGEAVDGNVLPDLGEGLYIVEVTI